MFPGADLDTEEKRAAAIHRALGDAYGAPGASGAALCAGEYGLCLPRDAAVADLAQLDEALAAVRMGPLPPAALAKLDPVWASNFGAGWE